MNLSIQHIILQDQDGENNKILKQIKQTFKYKINYNYVSKRRWEIKNCCLNVYVRRPHVAVKTHTLCVSDKVHGPVQVV